jgi:hypothetical protein
MAELTHVHENLKKMTPTRLQVELWRVVDGEPWGNSDGRMVSVPAAHLKALLTYAANLEQRCDAAKVPQELGPYSCGACGTEFTNRSKPGCRSCRPDDTKKG